MPTNKNDEASLLVLKRAIGILDSALGLNHLIHGDGDDQRDATSHFARISDHDLYTQLLQLVGGDNSIADRLIKYEQDRAPDDDRKIWIARAISRILADRRI